ncbi:zinc carboxypeptidase-like [Bolinopsis microptera]|uniref:zinc carboxypeptidase-like n=1 Tax=Bolinopsis microptera TaxID=2820187 RepID=UPI00307AD99D
MLPLRLLLFVFLSIARLEPLSMEEKLKVSTSKYTDIIHNREKRWKSDNGTYKIENDEDLFNQFTTEQFTWIDNVFTNKDPSYYNYTGYNSFEPIRSELYRLADKYDYVDVEVYGITHEKRELIALHINKGDKDDVVVLNSLIHAREWVVGCVTMNIIHRLLEYDTVGAKLLLNNFHFVIIPVVNPDGYEYTHTKNRMWRKNREPTLMPGCFGVDINRNFMYGYKPFVVGIGNNNNGPCSEQFPGTKALSTKESLALNLLLFKNRHNMRYYIDYHTYGNMWTNAYGATSWLPKNEKQLKRYRENVERSFMNSLGVKWKTGGVHEVIYECNGILVDHAHYYITPIAFTVEVGSTHDEFTVPDTRLDTYIISQWLALVSQLELLHSEIQSGQYMEDRTRNWRRTSMMK